MDNFTKASRENRKPSKKKDGNVYGKEFRSDDTYEKRSRQPTAKVKHRKQFSYDDLLDEDE